MKLRQVDPKRIVVPETRVTAVMDEETTEQFKASVATVGIDEPIKCYQVDGRLILSDGKHRLQEALALNLPLVDVYVREGTMVDVLCNNLMSGHLRGKHPLSGMVKSIEELWKVHKLGPDEVAKKTGLTRDHVEGIMLISQLTPMVRAAVDDGNLNFSQALALTRIKDPVCQETVFCQWQLARWSAKELNDFVSQTLQLREAPPVPQPPGPPPPPVELRCFFCAQVKDIGELKNPNICIECSGILLGAMAQARAEIRDEPPPDGIKQP